MRLGFLVPKLSRPAHFPSDRPPMFGPFFGTAPVRLGIAVASAMFLVLLPELSNAQQPVSFNRDIRPILSDACFTCHGPDLNKLTAGLRLDVRDSAIGAAESGTHAIVPGDPTASELLRRVASADDSERMPPPETGKRITATQIELLRSWIAQGAEYQEHWAFIPPQRPALPEVSQPTWPRNPIDRFVLARLERDGLVPAPEADRATLIRRLSLDLTGLPPTPAESRAFLQDESADAYENLVERLLASPHYGEQMAQRWLDLARYADSNGFQADGSRDMWAWRDWLINAYNRNLPFDQFTIEQLAGDMLPDATHDQRIASGFNRNHRLNGEGGRIEAEWFVETVIDRVETTGLTWLGLTLGCSRCHDHKYDPISQREFYQLFAYFNSVDESGVLENDANTRPLLSVATEEQTAELARLKAAAEAAEAQLATAEQQLPELIAQWEPGFTESLVSQQPIWTRLKPEAVKSLGGASFEPQPDGSYLATGTNPTNDTYEIQIPLQPGQLTAVLLECLPDERLPNQSVGRYSNGNFVLTRWEAEWSAAGSPEPRSLKVARAEANFSQSGWEIGFVNQGNPSKGWAVDGPTRRALCQAMFVFEQPLDVAAAGTLTIRMHHEAIGGHNIGRFRLSGSGQPSELLAVDSAAAQVPEEILAILRLDSQTRTDAQRGQLTKFYRERVSNPVGEAEREVATARKRVSDFEAGLPTTMVMKEVAPRDAFVLLRGEYDKPGEKVERALPAIFPPLPAGAANDRLGLARWIVDRGNPLTARVWVNRTWESLFGMGIVKTSENFGSQADYPSHPELLDWLAVEFMEPQHSPPVAGRVPGPWDMKALIKLIVTSATYRQASPVSPDLLARDPENRLLGRAPRYRLTGETIRDQALLVSGLLVPKVGGPSVRPYMPEGVWDETSRYGNLRNYQHDRGQGLYRRSLYTIWKRTAAPPTMLLFDSPNREVCTVKRSRTNTPLQALSLLNEITFVEAARKLGERMILEGGQSAGERLAYGFRLAVAREPSDPELSVLVEGLQADLNRFGQDRTAAEQLLVFGDAPSSDAIDVAERAAYTLAANVLLNLDEFVTRE